MVLKKMLGEILAEMGFVSKKELKKALNRQKELHDENDEVFLPERFERPNLVSEARALAEETPLLGQILTDMGLATQEQIELALKRQEETSKVYRSLDNEKLGLVIEIGSIVNSTLNLSKVLSLIMKHVNRVTDSLGSTLMLIDEETGELVFSVPTGPEADKLTDIRLPIGKGVAGWVAQHGKPVIVPDANEDSRFYSEIDKVSGLNTNSILCVPLKAKTELIGVLEVINKSDGTPFSEADALFLSIFASQASMAIENARLYSELKEQLKKEKETEEEKKKLESELRQAQKMEAIGTLAGGIAHDFNNILAAILGYGQLAMINMNKGNGAKQNIEQILKAGERARELVKQILTFSRQTEHELKPLNIISIVKEVIKFMRVTLPSTVEISQNINIDSSLVLADATQIHQVLMNLCTNALHAMREEKGELEVSLTEVQIGSWVLAKDPNLVVGPYIKLAVRDTGEGIDARNLERIFDPYFTTKKKGKGTGLGLSVVMGIVKNHKGFITVDSELEKGSTFNVFLPCIENSSERETGDGAQLPSGNERILVVDDEEVLAKMGQQMFEHLGYEVDARTSSLEALEAFRAQPDKFDLVLTDRIMPQMTGFNLASELNHIRPGIPIILCTGFSDTQVRKTTKSMGISEVVMKPIVIEELAKTIRKVLDENA